jgi:hypothetical protein
MRTLRAVFVSACLAGWALSSTASAQSDTDKATARALAQQGAEALDARDFAKAEDAFRRADGLYHAPTIGLGLARAQVGLGKFVEAWETYNKIIIDNVTTTPVFAKALEDAKREIGGVDARRSRATLNISGSTAAVVTLDHRPVKIEALGIPMFVDPGTHTVEVSATGFDPATRTFSVGEGKSETVTISLEAATAAPTIAPPGQAGASAGGGLSNARTSQPPGADTGGGPSKAPAIVAFAVGGVGLVTGIVAGVIALGQHSDLSGSCPGGVCGPSDQSKVNDYHSTGLVSTLGFVVAGVGAAAGITLWMVESKSAPATAAWISPYVGPGTLGAVGRF